MTNIYLFVALAASLARGACAFSLSRPVLVKTLADIDDRYHHRVATLAMAETDASAEGDGVGSNGGDNESSATPQSFGSGPIPNSPPPATQPRLDPLIASLTRMDPETAGAETTNVPLIGEIPKDGSIIPLGTAAALALIGFLMSINIALNSKDAILASVQQTTDVMATPPVMKTVPANEEACRGLCGSQEKDLENLRNFMVKFAK